MQEFPLVDIVKLSQEHCQHPIQCKLAYASKENFLGRVVDGYHPDAAHLAFATPKAAMALCNVQMALNKQQLGVLVLDSYRPLRAVRDFKNWMHSSVESEYELERKKLHYPSLEKNQLAELGYIAEEVSNHCFGDTIDLVLIDLKTKQSLNMGAIFDYFDEISHPVASAEKIGQEAFNNRIILTAAMQAAGFNPYEKEFWHFEYKERDILQPLDFEITRDVLE